MPCCLYTVYSMLNVLATVKAPTLCSSNRSSMSCAWWFIKWAALSEGRVCKVRRFGGINGVGLLTGKGSDVVIVIIRHSRVGPGVGIFISSSIQWRRAQCLLALSVSLAKSHGSRADVFVGQDCSSHRCSSS